MEDSSIGSRCSRTELAELDDLGTSLLHTGSEFISDPVRVYKALCLFPSNRSVANIRIHSRRVVAPNGHLLDFSDRMACLESQLSQSTVVIESGHGCKVFLWDVRGVVLADQAVSVGWVTHNNGLNVT